MSVFANVNGETKELYRIFFNDNGLIREVKTFHAQNNNEVKPIFVRDSNTPSDLQWVAYDGDDSTINSVTNNGYTISGTFTSRKRSVETVNKIFLPAGTKIRIELSNTVFDTDEEIRIIGSIIYLFNTESTTDYVQDVISFSSSNTMMVKTTGDYYITLSVYGLDASGNAHHCTTDVNVAICPPMGLEWITYWGEEPDSSTINSVTNNGYTISGTFTDKKRSISTKYKQRLLYNTKIRVELSNTKYDTDVEVTSCINMYLFKTDSLTNHYKYDGASSDSSNTMNVMNTGDYYIALSIFGRDDSGNIYYCTTDVNVYILPPN